MSQDPSFLDIGTSYFKEKYGISLSQHLTNPQALNSYSYGLNNPIVNKDPKGEFILPVLAAGWAIAEFALSAYDAYSTTQTLIDPNSSFTDKTISGGLFVAGLIGPGGGYGNIEKSLVGKDFGKLGKIIENTPGKITGFTEHGINQTIERGVTPSMLLNTTKNPSVVLQQSGNTKLYLTDKAAVVLNKVGQVVTTYTSQYFKPAIQNILKQVNNIKKK